MLPSITNLSHEELHSWLIEHNEKPFRANQIFHWLYHQRVSTFDEMHTISKKTRAVLQEHFCILQIEKTQSLESKDGSIKYLFRLQDGREIESVLMKHKDHNTLCLSSQVGCAMGCDFCMTAKMGFVRHLNTAEIIAQVLQVWQEIPESETLRNVVFMGMGEPFHNYDNVVRSLKILVHGNGFSLSHRRITISTSGLVPKIIKFGQEAVQANLAISLNAVNNTVRTLLMPVNKAYNLERLIAACKEYPLKSQKRLTFEYILMDGVTDSQNDAKKLLRLLHGLKYKINLIPYNSSPGSKYQPSRPTRIQQFQKYLLDRGVVATLRISKGQDIQGACGQLLSMEKKIKSTGSI